METEQKLSRWPVRLAMSSNPFDIAEQEYKSMSPFDIAVQEYQEDPNRRRTPTEKFQGIASQIGGNLASAAAGFAGVPGNLQAAKENLLGAIESGDNPISKAVKFARDPLEAAYQYLEQYEPLKEAVATHRKLSKPAKDFGQLPKLPTSEELKKGIKQVTGGALEPTNQAEKALQETSEDIGAMFFPLGGHLSTASKIVLPVLGNLSKQGLKFVGASDTSQEIGKLGTTLIGSIARLGNAPKYAKDLYQYAKGQITGRGIQFDAAPIQNALTKIEQQPWFKAGESSSKAPAMRILDKIKKAITGGKMDLDTSVALREDINEELKKIGAFKVGEIGDKGKAIQYLNEAKDALIKGQSAYGKTWNPQWYKLYEDANRTYAITQKGGAMADFIQKNYTKPFVSEGARVLFHRLAESGFGQGIAKVAGEPQPWPASIVQLKLAIV